MTKDEMAEIFAHDDQIYAFRDLVENKRSNRADLHAILLLDSLDPGPNRHGYFVNVLAAAEHDEVYFCFDEDKVAEAITPEQVVELRRCGIRYSNDGMGFCMFV